MIDNAMVDWYLNYISCMIISEIKCHKNSMIFTMSTLICLDRLGGMSSAIPSCIETDASENWKNGFPNISCWIHPRFNMEPGKYRLEDECPTEGCGHC